MANIDVKNKVFTTLLNSFNAMPAWLRNTLIVALCFGFFYFGYARKEIIYSKEKETTTEIFNKIGVLNRKIEKIEEIRIANEDMLYNIEEVRGIVAELSELHNDHVYIITNVLKPHLSADEYRRLMGDLDDADREYKKEVNELFEKKSKEHLKNSQTKTVTKE